MPDQDKPAGIEKPRSNIYTVMAAVTAAAFLTAIILSIMEMQDVHIFGHQLFGEQKWSGTRGE